MKKLPIGISTFENIVTSGALYVDKTKFLYDLVKPGIGRYFFSRPRRFGKSTTCSTLFSIFSGKKALFKDLWIGQSDYEFVQRPVVRFDFSRIDHENPEQLVRALHDALNAAARQYEIALKAQELKTKFAELIITLGQTKGPVVVIIDEYDKPITSAIEDINLAKKMGATLGAFYGALKGDDVDANLHFLFVTGVTKFSKVSLFSELNNLNDITNDPMAAALVGYTDQDVDFYLHDHIQAFADARKEGYEQTRQTLREWYNGLRFSKSEITVYNPFSLHNCLSKKDLANYWFTSGTPRFLIKIFEKEPTVVKEFVSHSSWEISESEMETFSPDVYYKKIIPLLLQTGYLTIKGYDALEQNYVLDYPNYEIRLSMAQQIMEFVGHIPTVMLGKLMARFIRALQADDIDAYCTTLRDYLKQIPHDIIVDQEKFFQATFVGTALLVDVNAVVAEVATDRGYVDVIIHSANKIFVMEFKRDKTPEVAMQQILEKKYYEKFMIHGNPIVLVGTNFDLEPGKGVEVSWNVQAHS